jgi:hypothetical protein
LLTAISSAGEKATPERPETPETFFAAGVLAQVARSWPTDHLADEARRALIRLPTH